MTSYNYIIYSTCDFSEKNAAATRMLYYSKALADQNNRVYLMSCCLSPLSEERFTEIAPNIFVLENKTITTNFISTFTFLKSMHGFSRRLSGECSFIFYPYPHLHLQYLSVFYLIWYKRNQVFYEFNEVRRYSSMFHDPMSITRIKYSLRKLLIRPIYRLLEFSLASYSGLICISTTIENYGRRFNKNTLRIPILTDSEIVIKTTDKNYSRIGLFNIGFSGSIVPNKESLFEFIDVIGDLQANNYSLVLNLCGTLLAEDLEALKAREHVNSTINYYGNLSGNELSTFLVQQDLLVIPRGYTKQNKYGFATKLSDYLNHRKVILLTDISDNGYYIKDGVNGLLVPPDDRDGMLDKLTWIIENFDKVETSIITKAYNTSKNELDYRRHSSKLRSFLLAV